MVNPRAKVHLEWTTVKGVTRSEAIEDFKKQGIDYVSDQVMIAPVSNTRRFGLYCISGEDAINIAMPVYDWGIFYERIIDQYIAGVFKNDKENQEAINYWWGLSAGVVDILCSKNVPTATMNLVNMVKNQMKRNNISPFMGKIVSQKGEIKHNTDDSMSPGEIVKMNWLVDNVVGDIPEIDELKDAAKSLVNVMGVNDEDTVIS
jgi:basic membrane lipoprotein Med (substrate-binding protein (PBP1-ABC) superfamily)